MPGRWVSPSTNERLSVELAERPELFGRGVSRSIKRTCRRFLVRATNHGDRAVRAVEHSVADRTEQQSGDPAAATGTDDEQAGELGLFD